MPPSASWAHALGIVCLGLELAGLSPTITPSKLEMTPTSSTNPITPTLGSTSLRVVLLAKAHHEKTGVGRYVSELRKALTDLGHEVILVHPAVPIPNALV